MLNRSTFYFIPACDIVKTFSCKIVIFYVILVQNHPSQKYWWNKERFLMYTFILSLFQNNLILIEIYKNCSYFYGWKYYQIISKIQNRYVKSLKILFSTSSSYVVLETGIYYYIYTPPDSDSTACSKIYYEFEESEQKYVLLLYGVRHQTISLAV